MFCFLDSTYMWDHTIFVFLWIISLSLMSSRSIHVFVNGKFSSFYGWIISHCIHIPQFLYLFLYSSTDGHLGCLNNAAVNIGVNISFWGVHFSFPLNKDPEVELLPHGSSIFSFLSAQEFPFLHILTSTCFFGLFNNSHSNRSNVIFQCAFDLHFPEINDVAHLSYSYWLALFNLFPFIQKHLLQEQRQTIEKNAQ